MKHLHLITILCLFFIYSCRNQDYVPADYNIRLKTENTYKVGEPVKFEIIGNVDNLLFYSGETGHEYKYFQRYKIAPEDIKVAQLEMDIMAKFGTNNSLDIFLSNSFEGLSGNNPDEDRKKIEDMVSSGMKGWTNCNFKDGGHNETINFNINLKEHVDNCCIAIHWHPTRINPETGANSSQRTYWINANLVTNFGKGENSINIRDIPCVTFMTNPFYSENPYKTNGGNGYARFNLSGADLILQGVSNTAFDFDIDAWLISKPMELTAVVNDQPEIIKDMKNYMNSYEYIWNEPGTYVVNFVGINTNYAGTSQLVKEFKITITE